GEGGGGGGAGGGVVGVLGRQGRRGGGEPFGDLGPSSPHGRYRSVDVCLQLLEGRGVGSRRERRLPGQQLVQGAAEGVDVGAAVDRVWVEALLGRQVIGGAQVLARRREPLLLARLVEVARHPQIEHLDLAGMGQHQVGRLDVAVNKPLLVQVL